MFRCEDFFSFSFIISMPLTLSYDEENCENFVLSSRQWGDKRYSSYYRKCVSLRNVMEESGVVKLLNCEMNVMCPHKFSFNVFNTLCVLLTDGKRKKKFALILSSTSTRSAELTISCLRNFLNLCS